MISPSETSTEPRQGRSVPFIHANEPKGPGAFNPTTMRDIQRRHVLHPILKAVVRHPGCWAVARVAHLFAAITRTTPLAPTQTLPDNSLQAFIISHPSSIANLHPWLSVAGVWPPRDACNGGGGGGTETGPDNRVFHRRADSRPEPKQYPHPSCSP